MLGIVERQLSPEFLGLIVGMRFGMVSLAVIALYWGLGDIWEHIRGRGTRAPFLYYLSKVVMSVAVLCFAPGAFMRYGSIKLAPQVAGGFTLLACFLVCVYFILLQTVKHIYAGEKVSTAWKLTIPHIVATALLVGLGALTYARG